MIDESALTVNNCSQRVMYRRPKFLEVLLEIRREMALESDHDVHLFVETVRTGSNLRNVAPSNTGSERPTGRNEEIEVGSSRGA